MQTLNPVQANEREIFMDVLRGFAILGIEINYNEKHQILINFFPLSPKII